MDIQVECCDCGYKHHESERIAKPSKRFGDFAKELHCPGCNSIEFYILDDNSNGSPDANLFDPNELPFIDPEQI